VTEDDDDDDDDDAFWIANAKTKQSAPNGSWHPKS
jgi:hypothetical protein